MEGKETLDRGRRRILGLPNGNMSGSLIQLHRSETRLVLTGPDQI